jgi:hypothetical protein
MKSKFLFLLMCVVVSSFAQQPNTEAERMLQALKQSGMVRQEGNTFIYKVQKASDTAKVRLMYNNLFSNPNYNVRFEVAGQSPVKVAPPLIKKTGSDVTTISTAPANPGKDVQAAVSCCFCNIKTFQYVGVSSDRIAANLFSEYSWMVPAGITKIKIEGWSAGGNGGNSNLQGGGGGGGAYVSGIVTVEPGSIIRIRVPGGGSSYPLTIQFATEAIGYLSIESGHNAQKPEVTGFDGKGGRSLQSTGVFNGNVFCFAGENGLPFYKLNYEPNASIQKKYFNGNNGGAASHGGFGGRGATYDDVETASRIYASDGTFPGGGGGGGLESGGFSAGNEYKSGKGASGIFVIYY